MTEVEVIVNNWYYFVFIHLIYLVYYCLYFICIIIDYVLGVALSIIKGLYYLTQIMSRNSNEKYVAWDEV